MFPLAIDPIVFSIGSLPVHWYGLILGVGALAGLFLAIREGKTVRNPARILYGYAATGCTLGNYRGTDLFCSF